MSSLQLDIRFIYSIGKLLYLGARKSFRHTTATPSSILQPESLLQAEEDRQQLNALSFFSSLQLYILVTAFVAVRGCARVIFQRSARRLRQYACRHCSHLDTTELQLLVKRALTTVAARFLENGRGRQTSRGVTKRKEYPLDIHTAN